MALPPALTLNFSTTVFFGFRRRSRASIRSMIALSGALGRVPKIYVKTFGLSVRAARAWHSMTELVIDNRFSIDSTGSLSLLRATLLFGNAASEPALGRRRTARVALHGPTLHGGCRQRAGN